MIKRNGKPQHFDTLELSTKDCIQLAREIEPRFLTVCELYGRKWGGQTPPISKEMEKHFMRWRQVVIRHRNGDMRNTLSEWQSMKEVAQWTVDLNCKLCGQEPKTVEWAD